MQSNKSRIKTRLHVSLCMYKATNAGKQLIFFKSCTNCRDSAESSKEAIIAVVFGENSPSSRFASCFTLIAASENL